MIFLSVAWGIYGIGDVETLGRIGRTMILTFLKYVSIAAAACTVFFPVFGNRFTNGGNQVSQIKAILDAEGEKILSSIPQGAYKIALCVEGKKVTSEALSKMLTELPHKGFSEAVFIIGSSHGLADKVKSACDFRLSVSDMTFPHRLMRVILSEQLYRACTIEAQTGYHK